MLNHMLMEELFGRGIMRMGPAREDPGRQVGIFNMRQTWTKVSGDEFRFVNEERLPDGDWGYVDEWEFRRNAAS
jgi:hypothetical protein